MTATETNQVADLAPVLREMVYAIRGESPKSAYTLACALADYAEGGKEAFASNVADLIVSSEGRMAHLGLGMAERFGLADEVRAEVERMVLIESEQTPGFVQPGESVEEVADELIARAQGWV